MILAVGAIGLACAAPLPDRFIRRESFGEIRAGHAILETAPEWSSAEIRRGWGPNVHVTSMGGFGGRVVQATLAVHAAVGRYSFEPRPEWPGFVPRTSVRGRVEARAGVRFLGPGRVFAGVELGTLVVPTLWPLAVGSIGWAGGGYRVRPVIAVEARLSGCLSEYSLPSGETCLAQPGIGIDGGVRFGRERTRVSDG